MRCIHNGQGIVPRDRKYRMRDYRSNHRPSQKRLKRGKKIYTFKRNKNSRRVWEFCFVWGFALLCLHMEEESCADMHSTHMWSEVRGVLIFLFEMGSPIGLKIHHVDKSSWPTRFQGSAGLCLSYHHHWDYRCTSLH